MIQVLRGVTSSRSHRALSPKYNNRGYKYQYYIYSPDIVFIPNLIITIVYPKDTF